MLIACKYEEIWPPLIKDYIYMCDNAYDKEQIINMELSMLSELDFNLDFVSANSFLERFVQVTKSWSNDSPSSTIHDRNFYAWLFQYPHLAFLHGYECSLFSLKNY